MEFNEFRKMKLQEAPEGSCYRLFKIEDILKNADNIDEGTRCRVVGYIYNSEGKYLLKNVERLIGNSKCEIRVLLKQDSVVINKVPQPVQIFGEIHLRGSVPVIKSKILENIHPDIIVKLFEELTKVNKIFSPEFDAR